MSIYGVFSMQIFLKKIEFWPFSHGTAAEFWTWNSRVGVCLCITLLLDLESWRVDHRVILVFFYQDSVDKLKSKWSIWEYSLFSSFVWSNVNKKEKKNRIGEFCNAKSRALEIRPWQQNYVKKEKRGENIIHRCLIGKFRWELILWCFASH